MNVLQFCQRAKDLLASNQSDFVQFVLTGQDPDGTQACIDPIFNRVTPDSHLVAIRDYDSFLGISSRILLVDTNLVVYPVSNHEDTLSSNIHIRYEFTTTNVRFPLHYIQLEVIDIHAWALGNLHGRGPQNPQSLHWKVGRPQHDSSSHTWAL